jgi:hypothetical protein
VQVIPDFILDPIYDAIFAEFVRRGNIIFMEDTTNENDRNQPVTTTAEPDCISVIRLN